MTNLGKTYGLFLQYTQINLSHYELEDDFPHGYVALARQFAVMCSCKDSRPRLSDLTLPHMYLLYHAYIERLGSHRV